MSRWSTNRDLNDVIAHAEQTGWTVEFTGSGHLKITAPTGAFIFAPRTPSDVRGAANTLADLQRAWPEWPGRPERRKSERERVRRPAPRPPVRAAEPALPYPLDAEQPVIRDARSTLADVWPT